MKLNNQQKRIVAVLVLLAAAVAWLAMADKINRLETKGDKSYRIEMRDDRPGHRR